MGSIKETVGAELVVKNSRFLGFLIPVDDEAKIDGILKAYRTDFPGATHYCYAYIIGDDGRHQKASDDGEPQKTAGIPMLEVLKKNDLTNVLALSIRYFGGTLLGASGLVRAYAKSISTLLDNVVLTTKHVHRRYRMQTDYQTYNRTERILHELAKIESLSYTDKVEVVFTVDLASVEELSSKIEEILSGKGGLVALEDFSFYSD